MYVYVMDKPNKVFRALTYYNIPIPKPIYNYKLQLQDKSSCEAFTTVTVCLLSPKHKRYY